MEQVFIDLSLEMVEVDVNPTSISPLADLPTVDMTSDIISMNLAMAEQVADEDAYNALLAAGNIEPNKFYFTTED
jgi:hypothetical protein